MTIIAILILEKESGIDQGTLVIFGQDGSTKEPRSRGPLQGVRFMKGG
jgi:hypothetical protein